MAGEREHWTDPVLDERFRALDREVELMREAFEVLADMPTHMAASIVRSEERLAGEVRERDERATLAIAAVAKTCTDFRKEYREDRTEWNRQNSTRALTRTQAAAVLLAAALALLGTVVAALINAHAFG